MTQRRALQTRVLMMANNEKCWLHHCIDKIDRIVRHLEYQLHGKPAAMLQETRASAKRTQADHSRRESFTSSSSQEPRAAGKCAAMFSSGHEEPENLPRQILEGLLLKATKIIAQSRQDVNVMGQKHQVGSLNNCISELQQQTYAQRLKLQDAQHGYIESRREHVRLQEELSVKEKVLRDTQSRSMHEM